jgi:hypothetical protein
LRHLASLYTACNNHANLTVPHRRSFQIFTELEKRYPWPADKRVTATHVTWVKDAQQLCSTWEQVVRLLYFLAMKCSSRLSTFHFPHIDCVGASVCDLFCAVFRAVVRIYTLHALPYHTLLYSALLIRCTVLSVTRLKLSHAHFFVHCPQPLTYFRNSRIRTFMLVVH